MAKRPQRGEFEVGEEQASPAALAKAKKLAKECEAATTRIAALGAEEGLLRSRLNHLKTIAIPEALREAGISSFTHGDQIVAMEDYVSGTLPKEEKPRKIALDLMDKYGFGSSIRTVITIDYAKEDHEEAVKMYNTLRKKNDLNIEMKEDIHNQTYLSNIRQRLEEGLKIDTDKLNVYVGHTTKFKKAKEKKGKKK